jgi:cytochrome c
MRHVRIVPRIAVVVLLAGLTAASAAEPANDGKTAFNNYCRTCHSTKAQDNRLGPSLRGIVGAKAGQAAGYANYSQGLKQSGLTWDAATLDRYLADPEAVVPNNNMKPYKGIPDATVRRRIIEFLKSDREAS